MSEHGFFLLLLLGDEVAQAEGVLTLQLILLLLKFSDLLLAHFYYFGTIVGALTLVISFQLLVREVKFARAIRPLWAYVLLGDYCDLLLLGRLGRLGLSS